MGRTAERERIHQAFVVLQGARSSSRIVPEAVPAIVLTVRQLDILARASEGASNHDIGESLHLSEHTIKSEVAQLLRVLGARNRAQLVAIAIRSGLI